MKKVGITGQNGFVGNHLYQTLKLNKEEFQLIDFNRDFFENDQLLDDFVSSCDVIVHLAALNRHNDPNEIYNKNTGLVKKLIESLKRTNRTPHVIISSSTQEERDNIYGKSKKEAREALSNWAKKSGANFTGMIIPNVFGPFGNPFYNSVVATFCHQITRNEQPKIEVDGLLKLIYAGDLVQEIIQAIKLKLNNHACVIQHQAEIKVSEILNYLNQFKSTYQDTGEIPLLTTKFEFQLFNTFRCYMDLSSYFPKFFTKNTDPRGTFVELVRLGIGGQVSFSTTVPGITRGNHFHTRKIERFAVIKGKALIQLRQIGKPETLDFYLDGENPSYVDMPIWFTHNIKNIGKDELYTVFWINEFYDPNDPDTYFEPV
jgi:UDP-2-acetamido-2,6-beta-L-arabino-hexul-4-ose reductase